MAKTGKADLEIYRAAGTVSFYLYHLHPCRLVVFAMAFFTMTFFALDLYVLICVDSSSSLTIQLRLIDHYGWSAIHHFVMLTNMYYDEEERDGGANTNMCAYRCAYAAVRTQVLTWSVS
eukprot:COSAG06_NODE_19378_length_841_cov_0.880054_1_plen_119_part_00